MCVCVCVCARAHVCVCVCVYGLQHCIPYKYIQIAALPINSPETTGQHLISVRSSWLTCIISGTFI